MPARNLPNMALKGGYAEGENGWAADMTENLLKLSLLAQGTVIDKVSATPGSPASGDAYIFDETHATQPNKIAVFDGAVGAEAWVYITPQEGWLVYNKADNFYEKFDGAVWAELATGGTGSGVTLAPFRGALVYNAVALAGDWNPDAGITWANEVYDQGGWHSTASNTSRLVVPAGVNKVRLAYSVELSGATASNECYWYILKNGTGFTGIGAQMTDTSATIPRTSAVSAVVNVVPGDYFELWMGTPGNDAVSVMTASWFSIEAVEVVSSDLPSFRGARAHKSANQVGADYSVEASVAWNSEANGYDLGGWHDNVTNNSRMTVPAGVTKVRLTAQLTLINVATTAEFYSTITKNGAFLVGAPEAMGLADATATAPRINMVSGVMDCAPGDYFEVRLSVAGDTAVDIIAGESWFAIEAVEVSTVSAPSRIIRLASSDGGLAAQANIAVNSAAYVRSIPLSFPFDFDDSTFTQFRIFISGQSSEAGQTITAELRDNATNLPLATGGNDLVIANDANQYDSGWRTRASVLSGTKELTLWFKGSNATVDLNYWSVTMMVR